LGKDVHKLTKYFLYFWMQYLSPSFTAQAAFDTVSADRNRDSSDSDNSASAH